MQQAQQPGGGGASSAPSGSGVMPEGSAAAAAAAYAQHFAAQQVLAEDLDRFWEQAKGEVDEHSEVLADFKAQALPLARIKKIMKSDEDVRMISAEAPVLFARACEFFIQELTLRSWAAAQEYKRRTIQRSDVATAIARTDVFDFLVDIVPREEANEPPGTDGATAAAQLVGVPPPPVPMPGGGGAPPAAPQMGMLSPAQQQQQQQQQLQQQQQQQQGDGQQMGLQWPQPPQPFPPSGGQQFGFPPMQPFGMPGFGAFPIPTQPGMQQFPGGGQQQQ